MTPPSAARLVILYGIGGLSDVGRHAVRAALDAGVAHICVMTQHPELLELPHWKCSCHPPHTFTPAERQRLQVIKVQSWKDDDNESSSSSLSRYFADATAVISCLGNRQPGWSEPELKQGWVAADGTAFVLRAMQTYGIRRVVAMSSVGVGNDDWPPMEFFAPARYILSAMFVLPGVARRAYQDLCRAHDLYTDTTANDIDYLLVRPVGLGDEVVPVGTWKLQTQKWHDTVGGNMAKMDCARFMVQEALQPTLHSTAVVIGSVENQQESNSSTKS